MKTILQYLVLFVLLYNSLVSISQTINIHSITNTRQTGSDHGYTLDGQWMIFDSRQKLLNPINFGAGGTYSKSVSIYDGYGTTGSLSQIVNVPTENIFFMGCFNSLEPSTEQFTNTEIDDLYNWSLRGGKLIITSGGTYSNFYNTNQLNSKWGYSFGLQVPNDHIRTPDGNTTDIFNGPFGNVVQVFQGGGMQGYFASLPINSKVFARDSNGKPTLYMDCTTLDLLIAEVDAYTSVGAISPANAINNSQDAFWANTIVFMDKLQQPPTLVNNFNNLSVPSVYNSYQWYNNGVAINGANGENYTPTQDGIYYVETTVNGGCKVLSDSVIINTEIPSCISSKTNFEVPNTFTPNNDNINDNFCLQGWNDCIEDFTVYIYDRWGEKVFESKEPNFCWDGKYKELALDAQILVYCINAKYKEREAIIKKGNICLIK